MIRIIIMIKIIILTIIIIKTITDIDIEIHSGRSGRNATGRRWAISFKGDSSLMSLKQSNHVIDHIFFRKSLFFAILQILINYVYLTFSNQGGSAMEPQWLGRCY